MQRSSGYIESTVQKAILRNNANIVELDNLTASHTIHYVDDNNQQVAQVYFDGENYFVYSSKDTLQLNLKNILHGKGFYFNQKNVSLTLKGKMDLSQKIEIEACNVILKPDSLIESKGECNIYASALTAENANLIGLENIKLKTEAVILDNAAKLLGDNIKIDTALLKIHHGSIQANNADIDANSYYQKSGTCVADNYFVKCKNFYNDDMITSNHFILKAEDKVEFAEHSRAEINSNLQYTAKTLINRGRHIARNSIDFDIKETLTNFDKAKIKLKVDPKHPTDQRVPAFMRINAGSLYNTGLIKSNIDQLIALNGVFVNGYTEWSSIKETAQGCLSAKIEAKNLNIIAPLTVSLGRGLKSEENTNIASLLNVKIGLDQAWNTNISSLLSINTGAFIPNPTKLGVYLKALSQGDFNKIGDAIFTAENAYTGVTLLITALKLLAPLAGTGLGIAWNIILLGTQLPAIISMCKSLYDKGKDNIQFRDVIPLIVMCKSVALQAANTASMGINFSSNFLSSTPKFTFNADASTLLKAGFATAMTLAPGTRTDAIVNVGLPGLEIAGSSQSNTLFNYTSPYNAQVAGVVSQNFYSAQLNGKIAAGTLALEGHRLSLGGNVKADQAYVNVRHLNTSDNVDFNSAYITTAEFEQRNKLRIGGGQVNVQKDLKITGELDLTKTQVKAGNDIAITPSAQIVAKESSLEAGHDLQFDGKAQVHETLWMAAKNHLDTAKTSAISGDGVAVLQSQGGKLQGAVTTAAAMVENNELLDYLDLLKGTGQYSQFQPTSILSFKTDKPVVIDTPINREIGVTISGAAIDTYHDITTPQILGLSATNGDMINHGAKLTGSDTFVTATGKVHNVGGVIKGNDYLQVYAGGDIINECLEKDIRGAYDTVKQYQPAAMIGGSKGSIVYAKGKVINDASVITGDGNNYVFGEKGIESTPRTHYYRSYHKKEKSGLFHHKKKVINVYDTQVQQPVMASANGRVVIYSENGPVNIVATDTLSKYGADIYARDKDVNILDIVTQHKKTQDKSSLFGVFDSSSKSRDQQSIPTRIANIDPGLTRIHTIEGGKVNLRSVIVDTPGRTEISGVDGTNITLSVLQHDIEQRNRGFSISAFGIPIIGRGSFENPFAHDSTVEHLTRLGHSQSADEFGLNTISTAIDLRNTVNQFNAANAQGNLLLAAEERYFNAAFPTRIDIGKYDTRIRHHYETLAPGSIITNELDLRGSNKVTFAVPVQAQSMYVDGPIFDLKGVELHSSSSYKDNSSTLGFGPQSLFKPDVTVAHATNSEVSTVHVQLPFKVDKLNVNVGEWDITNARAQVGELTGRADKLKITTETDQYKAKNESFSVSTAGPVSYQQARTQVTKITETSALEVGGDLTDQNFKVKEIELTGAKIVAQGNLDLQEPTIKVYDVKTSSKTTSSGFSFNTKDMQNLLTEPHYKNQLNPKMSDTAVKVVQFNQGVDLTKGVQHSVMHGALSTKISNKVEGYLHTTSTDGKENLKGKSHHLIAELPLPTKENLNKFSERWDQDKYNKSLMDKVENLLNVTDDEIATDEVKRLNLLSNLVYQEDYGNKVAENLGLALVDTYFDPATSTHIAVYISNDNRAYIAFRGIDGMTAVKTDVIDIITEKPLKSTQSESFHKFINNSITALHDQGYTIYLTGHSRGAVQASVVSSEMKLPAIVFDSPGVPAGVYDLKKVLSFQAKDNVVNSYPKLGDHEYGEVWVLSNTPKDSVAEMALGSVPLTGYTMPVLFKHTLDSHGIENIGERVDQVFRH